MDWTAELMEVLERSFSQTTNRLSHPARLRLATVQISERLTTIFADRARPLAAIWLHDVRGHVLPVATALNRAEQRPDAGLDQRLAE